MVLDMQFPERLAKLRIKRNFTQKSLGEKIGVAKSQIYRYEKGMSQPSLTVLQDLAIALRVSADYLIFGDDGRELPSDLHHQFEAVSKMSPEDQQVIESLIEGMIAKYQTKQMVSGFKR
jgi:transcriptional regulator with XRE-family HTH domain